MDNNVLKKEIDIKETGKDWLAVWNKVKYVCYFLPMLTTIAFIVNWVFDIPNGIADVILFPIACVGWTAALITGPVKFMKGILRCVGIGWNLGTAVGIVGALIGGTFGAVAGLAIVIFFPTVFTMIQLVDLET